MTLKLHGNFSSCPGVTGGQFIPAKSEKRYWLFHFIAFYINFEIIGIDFAVYCLSFDNQ
jgi:hypothetical protein